MFKYNEDKSIYVTRGDYCSFPVPAIINGEASQFQRGDVIRFKATRKKDCNAVVIQRDFAIEEPTDLITIDLTDDDTRIGSVISKPTDFWYEVELNPDTNCQTIIGYDEDGPKILKLFPEGAAVNADEIEVVGRQTLLDLLGVGLSQAKASGEFDGKDGYTPVKGIDYFDGYTPVKGVDYFDGEKGEKGEQGDKGEQGEKGDKGDKGERGIQGETGKAGADGKNGTDGKDGADGYTPVKGVDYYTNADKAEFESLLRSMLGENIIPMTQAEYDALETVDPNKYYMIVGDGE